MLLPRVLTALVLLAVVLGALFALPARLLPYAAMTLPVLGAWEWGGLFAFSKPARLLYALALLGVCLLSRCPALPSAVWSGWLVLASLFWLTLAPVWLYTHWQIRQRWLMALLGALLLVGAWLGLVSWYDRLHGQGLLALMVVVWIADTAAYFTGRALGRHKLALSISPGKTWEGAGGAVVAVAAYLLWIARVGASPLHGGIVLLLAMGLLLTAVSIVGDLLESLFKRQAGLKDSGSILPGHGGILDRVDSLIAVLALAGAALNWMG